jgi:hypothetical protein
MIDTVEAFLDIGFERILRPCLNPLENRFFRIPTRAAWAKAIGMRRQFGFPFGFQGLAHERLSRPFILGGNAKGAPLIRSSRLGYPDASQRCRFAIEMNRVGQAPPASWREGLHTVDARRSFPAVM